MGKGNRLRGLQGGNNPNPPIQEGQIDMRNAVRKVCECGFELFEPVCELYSVSALLSPSGQELTVQKPVWVCIECKQVLK